MKKITKILLPFASIGATAAIAVPCLTSCRIGLMGTHDMLNPNYINHVLPATPRTIKESLFKTEYLNEVANNTDIIKDDILFTYSKALTHDNLHVKSKLDFTFSRYFLYVDDIKIDTKTNEISMHLWAEITAEAKKDNSGNYTYKLSKDATGFTEDKYVKSLTAVVGAYISAPYTFYGNLNTFTFDPFKDMHGYRMKIGDNSNVRVHITGTADMSSLATGANSKIEALAIDLATTIANEKDSTKTTGVYNLYNGLISNVSKIIVEEPTAAEFNNFDLFFMSYYFKNVKIIDD